MPTRPLDSAAQSYSAVVLGATGNAAAVERAAREAGATVAFCVIGVGNGGQKMPEAEVRKIEALPSRYHAIHKNELARAMFEGTQKALIELQQKQAQGHALPEPEVEFYEYSDMKPFFNKDDPGD